jgi:hypothetical protein
MLNLVLLFCAVTLSFNLQATEKRTHSGRIIVGDSSEYAYSNSSEANRQSLQFGLGMSGYPGLARYSIYYYLNPDLALEVFTRDVRNNVDDDDDEWDRKEKAFGASANFFTRDAWQFRLGVINRQAIFTGKRYTFDAATDYWHNAYDVRVSQQDYALECAVGSQWQWNSFYFGFDWLNYEHRLAKLNSSASLVVKDSDRIRFNYAETSLERARVADNDLNKTNLYMSARSGWSF